MEFDTNCSFFWIAMMILVIFTYGTPDLLDSIIFVLFDGHPEKWELIWKHILAEIKQNL